MVSAFKNPDTWLKSWCIKERQQELCDGVNGVEKIAMLVLQILTQMIQDSGVSQPQIGDCPVPREVVQEIVHGDDHEEETLQSDEEPAKKLKINEAYTLLRVVTTGKTQRFIQDTDAPLHDESVIAVQDKLMDASDDEVSDEDGCSMTIKANNKIVASHDNQYMTLHLLLTLETKDSVNEVCL